jgi:thioesterase domain-containing protein
MAHAIEDLRQQDDRCAAVPIRRHGEASPLFFVPTGGGDISYAFELAIDIDARYPIYALPWPDPESKFQPQTIEAMAARMVQMMQSVCPTGPYQVAGYSTGGILAYAIAHQLSGMDQEVSFIGLCDVGIPRSRPGKPFSPKELYLSVQRNAASPDMRALIASSEQEIQALSFRALLEKAKQHGAMDPLLSIDRELADWTQRANFASALRAYVIQEITTPVTQFAAMENTYIYGEEIRDIQKNSHPGKTMTSAVEELDERTGNNNSSDVVQSWLKVLPSNKVHVVLAKNISDHLQRRSTFPVKKAASHVVLLRTGTSRTSAPIICIPGAGASVTSFNDIAASLDNSMDVLGIQPRGLNPGEQPHMSIEAAAAFNIAELSRATGSKAVHLIGHSHGGLVAYEMAKQLSLHRTAPLTLTLIDTKPPSLSSMSYSDVAWSTLFVEFHEAMCLLHDIEIPVDHTYRNESDVGTFLTKLHRSLVENGRISHRTHVSLLHGSLITFAAARRTNIGRRSPYLGRSLLLTANSPASVRTDREIPVSHANHGWAGMFDDLRELSVPGNHFTMLKSPNAKAIADIWARETSSHEDISRLNV